MRYSLIIPHFDDVERLERLLSTVPVNRSDLEVIVIDDCSSDQYKLESIKLRWPMVNWLTTERNAGGGAARNIGLKEAKGDHLVFADSDDEFLPEAFTYFDTHVDDNDDLVYFLAEALQEADGSSSNRADSLNELCVSYTYRPSSQALKKVQFGHVVPWAKVYSRRFVESSGIKFEETSVSNDVAFNVLLAIQARNVRVVPVKVYRIHRRAKSLTADTSPEAFLERVSVKARLADSLKKLGVQELPSATGWMLASFAYGPRTVYRTWRMCLASELQIDLFRALDPFRWKRFMAKSRADRSEKSAAESSRGQR
ncbi:Glycosyl transferase family 2 [Franzmannia pantelleriensis]|uniref:Glycosyl transferase family 2 n=1 Tax=Franzmannia pantelleriensis TaxID=48727 RepID=A0A1G9ED60_9GAMM|nr:glycosyltransferase family 2 protein [Halomonas pantelleriensis]SDK74100.1 Glycosyl transferase family 2 [Halomonas pantelleriensis]